MSEIVQNKYEANWSTIFFYVLFVHSLILIISIIGLPHMKTRDFHAPQPISIEFAVIDEIVKTKTPPKDRPNKTEKKAEKPVQTPAQSLTQTPPKETKKEIKKEPPKEKKEEAIKPPPPEEKLIKPEIKKPQTKKPKPPEKKKPEKKEIEKKPQEDTSEDFASILKNLAPDEASAQAEKSQQGKISQTITADELSAVRQQLSGCWNLLPGAQDADQLAVELRLKIFKDRTLQTVEIVNMSRYKSDPFFRAAADNAVRAVRHPSCSPLNLPPNKYDLWNDIILNFDPRGMF